MRSFVHIHLHLIWSTKNREPLLLPEVRQQLYPILADEAAKLSSYITCINGMDDHIHCLLNYHPVTPLSDLMQQIKGGSSFWYNNKSGFGNHLAWQGTYAAFSVSPYMRKSVEAYIRNQEKHHQKFTFEEEMRWLQKRALNETME